MIMLIKGTVQGERSVHALTLLPLLLLLAALFSGLDVRKLKRTTGGIGISNTEATCYLHPRIPDPWQANILHNEQRTLEIPVLTDTLKAKRTTPTQDSGSSTKARLEPTAKPIPGQMLPNSHSLSRAPTAADN